MMHHLEIEDMTLRLQQLLQLDRTGFRARWTLAFESAGERQDIEGVTVLLQTFRATILRDLPYFIDAINHSVRHLVRNRSLDVHSYRELVLFIGENGDSNSRYLLQAILQRTRPTPEWLVNLRTAMEARLKRFEVIASTLSLSDPEPPNLQWLDEG
jgi:hypothetical protein